MHVMGIVSTHIVFVDVDNGVFRVQLSMKMKVEMYVS